MSILIKKSKKCRFIGRRTLGFVTFRLTDVWRGFILKMSRFVTIFDELKEEGKE